ncbi:hypothetical protein DLH72_03985 [Candidatus Gracilibacteria bacterium]|nr:MAG: hypothetical protein DLH72_03985 [Candidatus Gracilibacteria bacterium]
MKITYLIMKNYIKTNLRIEQILVDLQNGSNKIYGINKEQFRILQIYEGQYFMKNNGKIGILQGLREKIKVVPGIRYIRIYL